MMTPRSTPSLYSLPGLRATVRPIRASPRDSWMWPCRLSIGWYVAIASRTAELPTPVMTGDAALHDRPELRVELHRLVDRACPSAGRAG